MGRVVRSNSPPEHEMKMQILIFTRLRIRGRMKRIEILKLEKRPVFIFYVRLDV